MGHIRLFWEYIVSVRVGLRHPKFKKGGLIKRDARDALSDWGWRTRAFSIISQVPGIFNHQSGSHVDKLEPEIPKVLKNKATSLGTDRHSS